MINWFKKDNNAGYKDKLLNAFPKTLKSDVEAVWDILPRDITFSSNTQTIQLNNELLIISYRFYFAEPDCERERKLTETQSTILNCIYLRHHDGYLRQRRLKNLIDKSDYWVTPFTIQLLGEYVIEILQVLDILVNDKTINNYRQFAKENPIFWLKTEHRMISYWNEYYRWQFPKLEEYPGRQLINRINAGV